MSLLAIIASLAGMVVTAGPTSAASPAGEELHFTVTPLSGTGGTTFTFQGVCRPFGVKYTLCCLESCTRARTPQGSSPMHKHSIGLTARSTAP